MVIKYGIFVSIPTGMFEKLNCLEKKRKCSLLVVRPKHTNFQKSKREMRMGLV